MTSHNLKGKKFATTAYIDRPKYQGIKAKDNRYSLSNGNVAVTRDFTPTWDHTNYNDYTLFFPYSSFELAPGKNTYYCRVFAFYNGSSIGNSQFESFDGTGPSIAEQSPASQQAQLTLLKSERLSDSADNSAIQIDIYDQDGNKNTAEFIAFNYKKSNQYYTGSLKGIFRAVCLFPESNHNDMHLAEYDVLDPKAKRKGSRICRIPDSYANYLIRYAKTPAGANSILVGNTKQFDTSFGYEVTEKAPPIAHEINYITTKDGKQEYIIPPSDSPAYNRE